MYDCVYADVCEYVHVCARTHRFYVYHHDDFLACAYAVIKNFMQESKQRPWILQGKTLMALITNIEGYEWQRCYMVELQIIPEPVVPTMWSSFLVVSCETALVVAS